MYRPLYAILSLSLLAACASNDEMSSFDPVNWRARAATLDPRDSLASGRTYLSVYSQIYSLTEHQTHNLTVTVSLRNMNSADTVYVNDAEYFDTHGESIRRYFDAPILIRPMETVQIVIDEFDKSGGTGANFIFDWSAGPNLEPPHFEAVMVSTAAQQGLSFSTQGIVVAVPDSSAPES